MGVWAREGRSGREGRWNKPVPPELSWGTSTLALPLWHSWRDSTPGSLGFHKLRTQQMPAPLRGLLGPALGWFLSSKEWLVPFTSCGCYPRLSSVKAGVRSCYHGCCAESRDSLISIKWHTHAWASSQPTSPVDPKAGRDQWHLHRGIVQGHWSPCSTQKQDPASGCPHSHPQRCQAELLRLSPLWVTHSPFAWTLWLVVGLWKVEGGQCQGNSGLQIEVISQWDGYQALSLWGT